MTKLRVQRESEIDYQKSVIYSIDNKIDNLRETRTLGVAVRLVEPSGPGKAVVLALPGIIGLKGFVLFAFFPGLVSNARQSLTETNK